MTNQEFQNYIYDNASDFNLEADFAGSVYMNGSKFFMYCTPFWEQSEGIAIEIQDDEGDLVDFKIVPFELTGDLESDLENYDKVIRTEFQKHI